MPRTVLLIEDDEDSREALTLSLEDEGINVAAFGGGTGALAYLVAHEAPGVILLDLNMPDMGGPAFVARLKELPALAAIPVVLISGDSDIRVIAASLGVAGYCRKPLGIDQLLQLVDRFAPQKR